MLGARPARFGHPTFECLPCTKYTYGRIACGQSMLRCERFHGQAVDVDRAEGRSILGLERLRESADAGANLQLKLVNRPILRLKFACEGFDRSIGSTPPPDLVDGGVPERSIEPGNDAFAFRHTHWARERAHKRVLQDVLGNHAVADAALEETQERPVILEQGRDWCGDVLYFRFAGIHGFTHFTWSLTGAGRWPR